MSVRQEEIEQSATTWPWHFNPIDHRLSEEETRRAAKIAQKYLNENQKLFPREVLSKISIILRDHRKGRWREGVPFVELQDYVDGSNRPYSIKLDLGPHGNT
jgi:predicted RNA methylase